MLDLNKGPSMQLTLEQVNHTLAMLGEYAKFTTQLMAENAELKRQLAMQEQTSAVASNGTFDHSDD